MRKIYLDYNATTPLKPSVYEAMVPYLKELYGNPSSIHWAGQVAKEALMVARERVASFFHIDPQEIVFT
ncbi:MAG: aminotransferase class V-fold PLP-dependent enzyme, partial [Deltaproteobacteria bacterium]|nr:aminotransferase class V-fold PLP-dependent enzyme [Deltaproteobacteria bacterium]